jgi:hypothetical protein
MDSVLPHSIAPQSRPPDVDEISWDLPPAPAVEFVDLMDLTADEIFVYAGELQRECATLRELLHEALAVVGRLTRQLDQTRERIKRLLVEIRRLAQERRR